MSTIDKSWLIYQPAQQHLLAHAQDCAQHLGATLEPVALSDFIANAPEYLSDTHHAVALLESFDLAPLLKCAHEHGAHVGLLPAHAKSKVCRLFRIPPSMEDAMPLALQRENGVSLELLLCNGEVVTWMVTLGDVPFIELRKIAYQQGLLWQHVKNIPASILALFRLQPKTIVVTANKDTKLKTAIVGAVVIENDIESLVSYFADAQTSTMDGKLYAILVAPASIMDYLGFLATTLSLKPRLPKAISFIKTARLSFESDMEIAYYIDGQRRSARQIGFSIIPNAVTVNVGKDLSSARKPTVDDKDVMRVKNLPTGEEHLRCLKQSLPMFSSAQEEEFRDILITLRDYARFSTPFALLMVLSTMLATFGLFLDNAPVIIGAMLLAPLMGPLVSISMGILRNDNKLLNNALQVFLIGTGLTIFVSAMIALLLPYEQITDEIRTRLQPNLLDLGVAMVSGIAAAYAHARENLQKSLPGVAIAVALMPPACVMGIGLGWMNWQVISGAGLLFLTNLSGITLAGLFAFLSLGFSPVLKVNRELGFSLLLAVLISIPLFNAFTNTVVYERIAKSVSNKTYQINDKEFTLSEVSALPVDGKIKILAQLHSPTSIQATDIAALRDVIGEQLNEPVVLDVSLRLVQ